MTIPTEAATWSDPLDPTDIIDFVANFADSLDSGEEITGFTVELMPEAALLGIIVHDSAPRAPELINSNSAIRIWFEVPDEGDQSAPEFSGHGSRVGVVFTVTTNSDPTRQRQRTFAATVKQL